MATAYTDQVQKVYIAYYGRAADPVGLAYWAAKVETDGLSGIMASFGASAEATTLYGSLTNTAMVNALYQQSFGRDADFAGLMYYAGQLTAGTMTAVSIAQNIFDGASGTDATILANKLIVAKAYTTAVDTAAEVVAYSGTVAAASARALLTTVDAATVTASFDVATSVASIVTVANTTAAAAGQTIKLTTSTDNAIGGTGHDTFEASYTSANGMTLQSADTITGGAGKDMLNVTIGAAGTHQASDLTGVETVKGTFSAAGTLSLLGSTGVTHVKAAGSTAAAIISNIPVNATLEIENSDQNATFTYKASDVTGAADSATLTLNNVTTGSTVTVASIETVNVVSSGGGNVLTALTVAAANTVNITGSQSLNLGAANTTSEMIDGSAATGKLTIITDNANASTVKTGSANDTITSTGSNANVVTVSAGAGNDKLTMTANLGGTDILDGGAGTDTLVGIDANLAALTVPATGALITNFETVTFSDEYTTATTLSDIQAGITTVNLANASATATLDIVNAGGKTITGEAGALTVNLGGKLAGNVSNLASTLTIADTGAATTDTLTVNNTAINITGDVNINLAGAITSSGYELVTFNSGEATGNVEQAIPAFTITPDAVTAPVSLTLTGGNAIDFTISVSTSSTALLTIDASGMDAQTTGVTTLDIASTVQGTAGTAHITGTGGEDIITVGNFASTIIGGSGIDVLTGGTAADDISGGAGNDTITGSGGNDTINGNDGNDTITASTAGNYTVTGGAGTDSVDFGATLTQNDSFDGGAGTDTLTLSNASVTAVKALTVSQINTLNAGIKNVEILDFGTTLAQDIDLGRLDGLSSIKIGNLAGATVISGVAATNNVEIAATTGQTMSITLTDATGTADVVNINLKAAALVNANTITVANVETINVSGTDAATANAATINVLNIAATKATSMVVTGSDGLTLTNTTNTKVTNFDASGVVANDALDTVANMAVTYVSANTSTTAAVSIKGGAGNDSLTGNLSIDTISGGAGADIITVTAGNDVVTGGAGDDVMIFTNALFTGNSATTATHDGGAGADTINLLAAVTAADADFARLSSFSAITTTSGANIITLGAEADATGITSIVGAANVDTIDVSNVDYDNAISITGGDGADTITLGAAGQVDTLIFADGDGAATSARTLTTSVAASDTMTFTGALGQDQITGFDVGADIIKGMDAGLPTTGIGVAFAAGFAAGTTYFLSGAYISNTGVFTIAADGAGADTIIIEGDGTTLAGINDDMVVLVGIDSDDLVAANFVA